MISDEKSNGKTLCKHGIEPFACLSCRQNLADEIPLDHPCRNTCSGWKQGYDKGKLSAEKDAEELVQALQECINHKGGWMAIDYAKLVLAKWRERGV